VWFTLPETSVYTDENETKTENGNYTDNIKQAVVRGTTNPAPCCHLANDTDLLTPVLWATAGDNKQIDLWPADPFTRIDPKFNQVFPWSLYTFPENFMQMVQPFSRNVTNKETKKEIARKQYPVPLPGAG